MTPENSPEKTMEQGYQAFILANLKHPLWQKVALKQLAALDDYAHKLTGNEGEDDALTVLKGYVSSLHSKLAKNKAAREWVEKYGQRVINLQDYFHNELIDELRALQPEEKNAKP